MGTKRTRRIWELSRRATYDFVRALGRLRIDCDLAPRDSVYYPETEADVARLRHEFERRKAASLPGRWLSREALRRVVRIDRAGAIRTPGNAEANPIKAAAGFAEAAVQAGARVYERSPVTSIAVTTTGVRVRTAHAAVDADRVIIATGYATAYFKTIVGALSDVADLRRRHGPPDGAQTTEGTEVTDSTRWNGETERTDLFRS